MSAVVNNVINYTCAFCICVVKVNFKPLCPFLLQFHRCSQDGTTNRFYLDQTTCSPLCLLGQRHLKKIMIFFFFNDRLQTLGCVLPFHYFLPGVSKWHPLSSIRLFVQLRCLDTWANTIHTLSLQQSFSALFTTAEAPVRSCFPLQKAAFRNVLWSWLGLYGNSESFRLVCSHSLSGIAGNDSPHYLKYLTKH